MSSTIEKHRESLFTVTFNSIHRIETTVTSSATEVDAWINETVRIQNQRLRDFAVVAGFHIMNRPDFSKRNQYPVSLLQVCVGHRCLLFRILPPDLSLPQSLFEFLNDDRIAFVGVGIYQAVTRLMKFHNNVGVLVKKDLRDLVGIKRGRNDLWCAGLITLARELMHVDPIQPLNVMSSDWDAQVLSEDQIMYACVDAFVSFELGRILKAWEPM